MELTWHKDARPSTYYATHNGKRIATAHKDSNAWHGTVVGLGFSFGGRRLMDVKELAQRHVERIYGEGEWTLFPARDLRPGMVLGCDTWRGEEREVVSVDVDTDAQTVDVELSSESSRELGFDLDHTYAVGEYVRVRPQEVEVVRAEYLAEGDAIWFYEGKGTVTAIEPVGNNLGQLRITTLFKGEYGTITVYPGSTFERVRKAEETEQTPQVSDGDTFEATSTEPVRVEDVTPGMKLVSKGGTVTEATCGAEILRDGWQKGKVRHSFRTLSESLCTGGSVTLPVGTVLHRIVETEQAPQVHTLDDPADAQALAECEADQRENGEQGSTAPDAVEEDSEASSTVLAEAPEESAPCNARRSGWERPGPGRHRLPCILPAGHGGLHRDIFRAEWLESEAGQVIDLHPFTAIVDVMAGTGVLISPPAAEDVTLSEGGATLHDALLSDALRRLLPFGVEALEGEDGGLSLEGVTEDGRKVFSLYVPDRITTEPDFEEVAVSIEALRQVAGL